MELAVAVAYGRRRYPECTLLLPVSWVRGGGALGACLEGVGGRCGVDIAGLSVRGAS